MGKVSHSMKISRGWRLNIWVFIPHSWYSYIHCWRSNLSATWIQILNLHKAKNYDILAEGKGVMDSGSGKLWILTTASCTLAWKPPWTEEPGGLQSMGSLRVRHDWVTSLSLSFSCIGEGNGNPLQCSWLENPSDGKPGGLPSMGSHRVGHDWSNLAAAAAAFSL